VVVVVGGATVVVGGSSGGVVVVVSSGSGGVVVVVVSPLPVPPVSSANAKPIPWNNTSAHTESNATLLNTLRDQPFTTRERVRVTDDFFLALTGYRPCWCQSLRRSG
jgi:hypothetical protein